MKIKFINHPTIDDLKEVINYVNQNLSKDTFPKIATNEAISPDFSELWYQKYRLGEQLYSIAFLDKKIVGVSHVDVFHGRRKHGGKLAITVDVDYRNQGIGDLLLKDVIENCKKNGVLTLRAEPTEDNFPMIHLLKKNKFKIEGKCQKAFLGDDGRYLDLVEYVLMMKLKRNTLRCYKSVT